MKIVWKKAYDLRWFDCSWALSVSLFYGRKFRIYFGRLFQTQNLSSNPQHSSFFLGLLTPLLLLSCADSHSRKMSSSSNTESYLSSPPAILRTPSLLPEFLRSETIESEPGTADYSAIVELDNDRLCTPNPQPAAHQARQKRKSPPTASWIWEPPESPNGKLVIADNIK